MNIIYRNNKGYILILTLIVISVMSLFLLTFIQISANHDKQVKQTSDTFEVTSIAEMGVEYFDKITTLAVYEIIRKMKENIESIDVNDYNSPESYYSKVKFYQDGAMKEIIGKDGIINNILNIHLQKEIELLSIPNTAFVLNSYKPSDEGFELVITGISSSGNEKIIRAKIEFPEEKLYAIDFQENKGNKQGAINQSVNVIVHDKYSFDLTLQNGKLLNSNLYVNGILTLNLSTQKKQVKYLTLSNSTVVAKTLNLTNQDKKNNIIRLENGAKFCLLEKSKLDLKSIFQITGGSESVFILNRTNENLKNPSKQIIYVNLKEFEKQCKISLDSDVIIPNPDRDQPDPVIVHLYNIDNFLTEVNY